VCGLEKKLEVIISDIKKCLTPDLLKKEYREINKKNPMYGHCYVATETLYHLLKDKNFKPHYGKDEDNITHWWLQDNHKNIIDVTKEQYTILNKEPPYNNGKRGAFLTLNPSKRSKILMDRINGNKIS
tara:strand:+ start:48 stop:431 length:384 start_codon:yes stop_codon:yes gene_type:complete